MTTTSSTTSSSPISAGPLDVQSLVSALMQVNNQPLANLQAQATSVQTQISAFGQIQSSLSALETAATKLETPSAFQAASASVTGSSVTANVTGTPAAGTYNIGVSQLAQTEAVVSSTYANANAVVGTGTLTIQLGSYASTGNTFTPQSGSSAVQIPIDSTDNTVQGIADAINNAGAGVQASVVTDTTGTRLLLSSTNSGAANGFEVTVADDDGNNSDATGLSQLAYDPTAAAGAGKNMTQTQAATDAQFTVNGLSLTSASNSVTSVISGLTLNLAQGPAAGSPAGTTAQSTVTVGANSSAVQSTVNSFVTAYNSLVQMIQANTAYNASTQTGSVLTGDSTLGLVGSQLSSILSSAVGGAAGMSYLAQVGVEFQSDGTLSLDSTTFSNALTANPSGVSQLFSTATGGSSQQGIAVQMRNAIANMLEPNGAVTARQSALQTQLSGLNTQETTLQTQLTATQQSLTLEYSNLNAALEQMSQQQSQLTSMLASLPG